MPNFCPECGERVIKVTETAAVGTIYEYAMIERNYKILLEFNAKIMRYGEMELYTLLEVQTAIATAHFREEYSSFCREVLGDYAREGDSYQERMWKKFNDLAYGSAAFDNEHFARIIALGRKGNE